MRAWRRQTRPCSVAALGAFLASVALPRSALVFHTHPGGDHFHVHGEEIEGVLGSAAHVDDHHRHHHHHAHPHALGRAHAVAIEAADAPDLGHWHTQNPFHRAVAPAAPLLFVAHPVERDHPPAARDVPDAFPFRSHARGPPRNPL